MRNPDIQNLSPKPPLRQQFENIRNNRLLLNWFDELEGWHGYIRFLGMPQMKDLTDVRIDDLFVPPLFSNTHITPELPYEKWPATFEFLHFLAEKQRLVLLGDPGSGKSTLINWITMKLIKPRNRNWEQVLGQLVPIPMILRDLPIDREITWDKLWEAWLNLPQNKEVKDRFPMDYLERGQALILLDGLDELGDMKTRKALRRAIFHGMSAYPHCYWLISTRIVGYEEAPVHLLEGNKGSRDHQEQEGLNSYITKAYLAPFNDSQIESFTWSWYQRREVRSSESERHAQSLNAAIHANPGTLNLARIPNLLTMMALIYRVRAHLPKGRVELYNDISRAYLQSIDEYRGLDTPAFTLEQKMRWLARIGYEMQRQRKPHSSKEILADRGSVHGWLSKEMRDMGLEGGEDEADAFLNYITRRSGLLLPRGQDRYAFMHLSFQEYFAAVWLEEELLSPSGIDQLSAPLIKWIQKTPWRETFVLLFERLAARRGWSDHLFELLFLEKNKVSEMALDLLFEVIDDTYSGLSKSNRRKGLELCWDRELKRVSREFVSNIFKLDNLLSALLRNFPEESRKILLARMPESLALIGPGINMSFLSDLQSLQNLCFRDVDIDLEYLSTLPNLQKLILFNSKVSNLTALSCLKNLQFLNLSGANVSNVDVLSGLRNLQSLYLPRTEVSNIEPLSGLKNLQTLSLWGSKVSNVEALTGLKNLQSLYLSETNVSDVEALTGLKNLQTLSIWGSKVSNVEALTELKNLQSLDLSRTKVSKIEALSGLNNLQTLDLLRTKVNNIEALSGLNNLKKLKLSGTKINNVEALSGLKDLQTLDLRGTKVSNLTPLLDLPALEEVLLSEDFDESQIPSALKSKILFF